MGGSGSHELGEMTAETGIDDELVADLVGFLKFEEEDAGAEVVDVGEAEGGEGGVEFVGDDFDVEGREALFHCLVWSCPFLPSLF